MFQQKQVKENVHILELVKSSDFVFIEQVLALLIKLDTCIKQVYRLIVRD